MSPLADGTGRVHRGGGRVPVEVVVEPFGDGPVAESFAGPQLEDRGNHWAAAGVDGELGLVFPSARLAGTGCLILLAR
ncbi:MAG TPA: hypothetical protein VFY84_08205 [Jiangellales bacterium]|nr:hypothetical protein [Jiangellales bacterium]